MRRKAGKHQNRIGITVDLIHIFAGLFIIILAAFALYSPEKYYFFFPVIFALSAVVYIVSGLFTLTRQKTEDGKHKKTIGAVLQLFAGALLLSVFAASCYSLL